MSLQVFTRTRGTLEFQRRIERVVDKMTQAREAIDKKREVVRQTSDKDRREQTRAKLEKKDFFRRDR